jgi:cold shock protein
MNRGSADFRRIGKERVIATVTVKWFKATKGFDFIQPDGGGADIFVHITAVELAGICDLNEGQTIASEVAADKRTRTAKPHWRCFSNCCLKCAAPATKKLLAC